jgi:tetrahydromethanopterin S-methyltransferase subunit A
MTERRRSGDLDLDVENRLATLEADRKSDQARMAENHNSNQARISAVEDQVKLINAKMDLMLEAVHMAKGGWWAAGKIIGLILGIVSGLAAVASFLWWAVAHVSFRPSVAAALVIFVGAGWL